MNYTKILIDFFKSQGLTNWYGVPDSVLNSLVLSAQKEGFSVTINVNEGASLASAIGHYLATKEIPVVFLQNSGIGNLVNPFMSLAHKSVYDIPILFIVGGRGWMGVKDEPQHAAQGPATEPILSAMGIKSYRLLPDMSPKDVEMTLTSSLLNTPNGSSALIVHRNLFESASYEKDSEYMKGRLNREETIRLILSKHPNAYVFSTTGMISREAYESKLIPDDHLFMSVGGMGHVTSIALEFSLSKPDEEVVILDGDGAFLMHMGTIVTEAKLANRNLYHYVLDNSSHGSVGGAPTDSDQIDYNGLAVSVGRTGAVVYYECNVSEYTPQSSMLTVFKVGTKSRKDLGRPVLNGPMSKGKLTESTLFLVSESFYAAHRFEVELIKSEAHYNVDFNKVSIKTPGTTEVMKYASRGCMYKEVIAIGGGTVMEVARTVATMLDCDLHLYPTTVGNGVTASGHSVYYMLNGEKVNFDVSHLNAVVHTNFINANYISSKLVHAGAVDLICHLLELLLYKGLDAKSSKLLTSMTYSYLDILRVSNFDNPSEQLISVTYLIGNQVTGTVMNKYTTNLFHSASYYLTSKYQLSHAEALGYVVCYLSSKYDLVSLLHEHLAGLVYLPDIEYMLGEVRNYGSSVYEKYKDIVDEGEWMNNISSSKSNGVLILL